MDMTLNDYQQSAKRTAVYRHYVADKLGYAIIGLAGEAGELCNKLKKVYRDNGGVVDVVAAGAMLAELGDVLWYVAMVSEELNAELGKVAAANLDKLLQRSLAGTIFGSGDAR